MHSMTNNIAITGMGIVSSIGTSLETNRKSLLQATSGLGQLQKINSIHASEIKVGEVALSNSEISAALKLPPNHNFTRTALLGSLAAKEALVKAMGTGFRGVSHLDCGVLRGAQGAPRLVFSARLAERLRADGVQRAHLALTDQGEWVLATVVLEGSGALGAAALEIA